MPRRHLPIVVALFAGSGCAALIYEIVWFQLLQLVIGSSALSLGVLLATFMGGLCAGSLLLPRVVGRNRHPLRVFAALELAIAGMALAMLTGLPIAGGLYTAAAGDGSALALRCLVAAICLLPPTVLMGGTLPAIARSVGTGTPDGVSSLGFFYGGNIGGAVIGCLLAGFYLLRLHDMATATVVAAGINVATAAGAVALARVSPSHTFAGEASDAPPSGTALDREVCLAVGLSGAAALGAEVVWTRLLSLLLGATVYTFSIILAVFLVGLGLGSSVGAHLSRRIARPRLAFAWCQLLVVAGVAWTASLLARALPYWPVSHFATDRPWVLLVADLFRCALAVLPATLLWGASFPLALAALGRDSGDPGRLVARLYASNTLGAIAGALGFSMMAVPWLGTDGAQRLLAVLASGAALVMFAPSLERMRRPVAAAAVAGGSLVILPLTWSIQPVPPMLVAYGRSLTTKGTPDILYVGEGTNASVAVSELTSGVRNFHVSGKVEASTEPQDMRLQRMLGNIPALVHPSPRSVLVVGFGAGVTAGSFVPYPGVAHLVICEIEPLIPREVAPFFADQNYEVLADPRVQLVIDDARHFVLTTRQTFDVITSDPIHPWVKGAATLYTREYFESVRRHLNPGGVVTQWVPLYESDLDVVKSEIATFFNVFPDGTVWANLNNGEGYDVVLVGQTGRAKVDVDLAELRLARDDHGLVRASLAEVGFRSATELFSTYAGSAPDLQPWLAGAEINRDRNLRLQYLAGFGLNTYRSGAIFNDMALYRRFPDDLFVGSIDRQQALWEAIEGLR